MNEEPFIKFDPEKSLEDQGAVWPQRMKTLSFDAGCFTEHDLEMFENQDLLGMGAVLDVRTKPGGLKGPSTVIGRQIMYVMLLPNGWSKPPSTRNAQYKDEMARTLHRLRTELKLRYEMSDQFIRVLEHCAHRGCHILFITRK